MKFILLALLGMSMLSAVQVEIRTDWDSEPERSPVAAVERTTL